MTTTLRPAALAALATLNALAALALACPAVSRAQAQDESGSGDLAGGLPVVPSPALVTDLPGRSGGASGTATPPSQARSDSVSQSASNPGIGTLLADAPVNDVPSREEVMHESAAMNYAQAIPLGELTIAPRTGAAEGGFLRKF